MVGNQHPGNFAAEKSPRIFGYNHPTSIKGGKK